MDFASQGGAPLMSGNGGPSPAQAMTPFSGAPPVSVWRPEHVTDGYGGAFLTVGGSNPEEGHVPVEASPGPPTAYTGGEFFDLPTGGEGMYGQFR